MPGAVKCRALAGQFPLRLEQQRGEELMLMPSPRKKSVTENPCQNLLRVGTGGLRCSPYLRTGALLSHLSLPLAMVLLGIVIVVSFKSHQAAASPKRHLPDRARIQQQDVITMNQYCGTY